MATHPDATTTEACCRDVPSLESFRSMGIPALIARYRRGIENYDRRVFRLGEAQLDQAFLPDAGVGRWPARVLLGHLADAELCFVHRMRKVVAEENPILQGWDENAFIDAGIYSNTPGGGTPGAGPSGAGGSADPEAAAARVAASLGGFVAVVHTLRQWNGQWLETLDEGAFARSGMHTSKGPQTLKDILAYATWHLEHHARFLRLKIDRMLGAECCGGSGSCRQDGAHAGHDAAARGTPHAADTPRAAGAPKHGSTCCGGGGCGAR